MRKDNHPIHPSSHLLLNSDGGEKSRDSLDAHVAQRVERILGKDEVTGSSPVVGSNEISEKVRNLCKSV